MAVLTKGQQDLLMIAVRKEIALNDELYETSSDREDREMYKDRAFKYDNLLFVLENARKIETS